MDPKELPYDVKRKLITISERLPANKQAAFCQNAGQRICSMASEFVSDYKYTIFYSVVGVALGAFIQHSVRQIWIVGPLLGPLVDMFPAVFGLGGAAKGYLKDCDEAAIKDRVRRIVQEELDRARA